jgi:hypothetical protein
MDDAFEERLDRLLGVEVPGEQRRLEGAEEVFPGEKC